MALVRIRWNWLAWDELLMRLQLLAAFVTVFVLGLGAGLLLFDRFGQAAPVTVRFAGPNGSSVQPGSPIRVYVTGAVPNPGVYALHDGDRIVDAVEAAGGPSVNADTEAINFAERLHDEAQLYVPRVGEAPVATQTLSTQAPAASDPVDINRADANLLRSLPGIGATRAAEIVTSRQKDGPFKSTEDLIRRRLLPQSIYDQVKALIVAAP